jgi:hypothetical protein
VSLLVDQQDLRFVVQPNGYVVWGGPCSPMFGKYLVIDSFAHESADPLIQDSSN